MQTQGKWLSDLNQDKVRHKKRTGGYFLGPFFPNSPLEIQHPGMFGGTTAIKWRVQAWASRDTSVPAGLCSAPEGSGEAVPSRPSGRWAQRAGDTAPGMWAAPRGAASSPRLASAWEPPCSARGLPGLSTRPRSFPVRCSAPGRVIYGSALVLGRERNSDSLSLM